jgi:cystathionine beta-lyase/cystathionine gamma-synthase
MELSEILNELGEDRERYFNAIAPPIFQTSNFAFRTAADLRAALKDEYSTYLYTRGQNPTFTILRQKLAALDGMEDALVFSSGVAAIFIAILANVKSGDHIVSVDRPYSWTTRLFQDLLPRFGVTTTFIDGTRLENFAGAIRQNTRILYMESPNSLTLELQDLEGVAALARKNGLLSVIDNSYCSPLYQRPRDFGIDIAVQTATKYLGGHSDTVAGVLTGSSEMIRRIFAADFLNVGAGISPLNAWLLLRSLRTLEVRLERITASTETVAAFMERHPKVGEFYYPFSRSFPQYDLARKQMKRAPGLFSAALKANRIEQVEAFCNSLRHFLMAVSWGGHESLVFPVCSTIAPQDFDPANVRHRLIRFYIGLEDPQLLIRDLEQALERV